ncbi:hypothetical protein ACETRX_03965 [Labrys portucalensis]|uniref:ABC transporter permease n=1 Tax=Labrys neptuniae TaxID=376174 RepID=A0ABV6Z974_9HYPH
MTTPYQVTYPLTWRDKLVIYPLSVVFLIICAFLLAWESLAAELPRRGARWR